MGAAEGESIVRMLAMMLASSDTESHQQTEN
jgi:hypothetical protein